MAAEIIAGLGAFKSMMDIAKSLKDMDTAAVRNAAVIELQEKIFAAHTAQSALLERIGDLEKEVASFETWEAEKQRYELHDIRSGSFVYRLKKGVQPAEPTHDICATCYQKKQKRILQSEQWFPGRCSVLVCHECATVLYVTGNAMQGHAHFRPKTPG